MHWTIRVARTESVPLAQAATGVVELGPSGADADLLGDALRERHGDAG